MQLELIKGVEFDDLSPDGQIALAAYAVLLVSEPPARSEKAKAQLRGELFNLPEGVSRAFGEIFKLVGLRGRRQHNNMRRNDMGNARSIRNKPFTPVKNRRPAKRKAA